VAARSELSDDELETALIAAWLHDIGYQNGEADHESVSAETARNLLRSWGASPQKIRSVANAILATRVPQQPTDMVSSVLCDADLFHLSTDRCPELAAKLRTERDNHGQGPENEREWLEQTIAFMEGHRYHTPYGKSVLEEGKKDNIRKLRQQLEPDTVEKDPEKLAEEVIRLRARLQKEKMQRPDRGVETMFRTTSANHIMLSQMADNKANILITINSIILSVVVSVLVRKLEEDPRLVLPTILLVAVCLTTIVFAILATRPNIPSGRFTRDDIRNQKTNLLFFGNFHRMEAEEYEWSMKEMMRDSNYLYGSMIKDIYYLGKVLGAKYKYLRIAYNIFMFGFVVAVLSFVVVMVIPTMPY